MARRRTSPATKNDRREQHQQDPGRAHRQHREAEEAEHEADRAHRAREDQPGVPHLDDEPERAEREQERDDVRVDQRVEDPLPERHLDVVDLRAGEVEHEALRRRLVALELVGAAPAGSARPRRSRSASAPPRRSGSTPCARPRRPTPRCGRGSSRARAARRRRRSRPCRRRSFWMSSPPTLIGVDEPMFVCGAIASTSAASPIQTPAEAARAPVGRDVDDHRDLRRELALVDLAHRVREPAGRVEHDHDRVVAVVVRAVDLLGEVVRRDRVDVVRRSATASTLGVASGDAAASAPPRRRPPRREIRAEMALFTGVRIVFGRGSSPLSAKPISGTVRTPAAHETDLSSSSLQSRFAVPGKPRAAGRRDDGRARRPARRRARRRRSRAPMRFNMLGLHWQGTGRVDYRTRSLAGALERLAHGRRRHRPRRRLGRAAAAAAGTTATSTGSAPSQRRPVPAHRQRHAPARLLPLVEAEARRRARVVAARRPADDRLARVVGGRREDHALGAALRADAQARRRPPHRRQRTPTRRPRRRRSCAGSRSTT